MIASTLRQLEYVIAVADYRHFGKAAAAVGVSQPGLSSQIRELESRLGVALFDRAPHNVQVTQAGLDVIDRARRILRDVSELEVAAACHRGTIAGRVSVGAIPTTAPYLLPLFVQSFRRFWPDARLELKELRTADLLRSIDDGRVDIGLLA